MAKRQELRDALRIALAQPVTPFLVVKELRAWISVCDVALKELNFRFAAKRA